MTEEKTSIFSALLTQLRRVKHDYIYRTGRSPEMVFSIGRKTYYDLMNERELMFVRFDDGPKMGKDDLVIDGFKGRIVDGLSGFVIQILN